MLQWLFVISLAAIPFVYSTSLMDPEQSIRFAYLLLVGVLSLAVVWIKDEQKLLKAFSESVRLRNPVLLAAVLLFTCTLLSVFTASQKSEAWVEIARTGSFLFFLMWVTILCRAYNWGILSISISFCIIGLLLSVFALKDFFYLTDLNDPKALYGMTGRMAHRNLLAILLTMCLPFHAIVFQHYRFRWLRVLLGLNVLLILGVISLSTSRVGWVGLVIIFLLGFIGVLAGYKKHLISKPALRKLMLAFVLGVLVSVSGVGYYVMKNKVTATNMAQRWTSFFNYKEAQNEHTETIRERLRLWENTVEIIKENPVTGVGAGNWKFHFPGKGMANMRTENGKVHFPQPHNDFLWVWAETGIIGLLAFGSLFIGALIILVKALKRTVDATQFTILASAFCGIAAYFFQSVFDFPKERPVHLFVLACYLAIAGAYVVPSKISIAGKLKTRIILLCILVTSLGFFAFWVVRAYSEIHLKEAFMARSQGNYPELMHQLNFICEPIFKVDLTGTPIDWYRGEAAFYQQNPDAAKKYFESSLLENPYHLYSLSNLGTIYYLRGDTLHATENWQKALSIAPGFAEADLNMAVTCYEKGDIAQAAGFLSRFRLGEGESRHNKIITVILSNYATLLAKDASSPQLSEVLQRMAQSDAHLIALQRKMAEEGMLAREMLLRDAIFMAEMAKTLSPAEADSLRKFYKLNLD